MTNRAFRRMLAADETGKASEAIRTLVAAANKAASEQGNIPAREELESLARSLSKIHDENFR